MMRFLAPEDSGTQWKSVGYGGAISPDGKWLAYESRESGRSEVYVRQLPSGPGKWQISSQGGIQPRWSGDGRELFFRSGVIAGMSTLMTVPVQTEGAPVRRDPCQVSLRARRPRLCCHARRPAFHLYQRVETRGQCDADECRLELECGAGKEITVASGPTSDPRETQVAVFALLLAFNKSAPCASHIFRTRGLNRGAFFLQVAAF